MSTFIPWDRAAYPGGYHEQLNAQARAEALENMRVMLAVLVSSGKGTPETIGYLCGELVACSKAKGDA